MPAWDSCSKAVAARDVVVAVVADHGEGLGEHDERSHGFFVYESTLRVPLILAGPGVPAGRTAEWARTVDLAPTLLKLAGVDVPSGLDGVDLFGAESGPPRVRRDGLSRPASAGRRCAVFARARSSSSPRPGRSCTTWPRMPARPGTFTGCPRPRPSTSSGNSRRWRSSTPREGQAVDPEVEARLRALGYVVAPPTAATASSAAARDPKDMVGLWNRFEEANWAAGRGEVDGAVQALRQLVREDPSNETFRRSLTALLRKAGRAADAAALLDLPDSRDALTWHERAAALAGRGDVRRRPRGARSGPSRSTPACRSPTTIAARCSRARAG